MRLRGLIVAVLIVAMLTSACGCGSPANSAVEAESSSTSDAGADNQAPGVGETITVTAATSGYPKPYMYIDDNNRPAGYDIDVLKEVFNRLDGYNLEFEVTEFQSMMSGLNSGLYQIAVNSLSYNEERASTYLYSYPYDKVSYVYVTKKGSEPIKTFAEAAGKTYMGKGDVSVTVAIEQWNEKNTDKHIPIAYIDAETPEILQNIADGKADFTIIDMAMYAAYKSEYGNDLAATNADAEDEAAISKNLYCYFLLPDTAEGRVLRSKIDPVLRGMKEDGTLAELSIRHFGQDASPETEQYIGEVN